MRVVILGAGYAGVTCAARLWRKTKGRVDITLVNAADRFVERIRLHEQLAGGRAASRPLHPLLPRAVTLVVGRATAIDLAAHTLRVDDRTLPWDRLVLALGSQVDAGAVPGIREHAVTLDAAPVERLAPTLPALAARAARVVVVGGGLTGIETAVELAERWPSLRVTLLSSGALADGWSPAARAHLLRVFSRHQIELREGVRVRAVEPGAVATDHGPISFDACLWAAGFTAHPLPRTMGLAVNPRGQVLVDAALRSLSHPEVYAAGDVATPLEPSGDPLPMGCKSAGPMGAQVADNLARVVDGKAEQAFDWAFPFYCVSLGRRDGLIQFPLADASPAGRILRGRAAAIFKELICRGTVLAMHLDRLGIIGTSWQKTGRAAPLAPAASARRLSA